MRQYPPGDPLVFSHIPKCAGTSLRNALVAALEPSVLVTGVDQALVGGYAFDDLHPKVRSTILFGPEALDPRATLVSGHIAPSTTMARYPGADHITTLRDPRLRVISQWVHSRALSDFDLRHWGAFGAAFRLGRRPLHQYLEHEMIAPNVDNTITRFLTWPHPLVAPTEFIDESHDEELLAAAIDRLNEFAYVGVIENPEFLSDLGDWLGRELTDTRLNERNSLPSRRRPDVSVEFSADTLELLDHRTRIDRAVWAHVARRSFRDVNLDVVLSESWETSMARYARAWQEPGQLRPVKRTLDALYGLQALGRRLP